MSTGHLHTVILEDNRNHHLFNLMFMNVEEIDVLKLSLDGKPIPQNKLSAVNNLRRSIDQIINMAVVKDTQPESEKLSIKEIEEINGEQINEEKDEEKDEDEEKD